MKARLTLSLLLFMLAACAPQKQSAPFHLVTPTEQTAAPTPIPTDAKPVAPPAGESGVMGQALIGPACPVVRVEDPCPDKPYQGAALSILTLSGQPVTTFQTDAEGKFQVTLPPGDYILHAENANRFPHAADVQFTVPPGEFTSVTINYDSGLR